MLQALVARGAAMQPPPTWYVAAVQTCAAVEAQQQLEPPLERRSRAFTLQYTAAECAVDQVQTEAEAARAQISRTTGIELTGFRVLLFADADAYARYARLMLPDSRGLYAAAFTAPGLLAVCSPAGWPGGMTAEMLRRVLRHEMAHLAIAQRTSAEGMPDLAERGVGLPLRWLGRDAGGPPARDADGSRRAGAGLHNRRARHRLRRLRASRRDGGGHGEESSTPPACSNWRTAWPPAHPLAAAYQQTAREPWAAFLAEWAGAVQGAHPVIARQHLGPVVFHVHLREHLTDDAVPGRSRTSCG